MKIFATLFIFFTTAVSIMAQFNCQQLVEFGNCDNRYFETGVVIHGLESITSGELIATSGRKIGLPGTGESCQWHPTEPKLDTVCFDNRQNADIYQVASFDSLAPRAEYRFTVGVDTIKQTTLGVWMGAPMQLFFDPFTNSAPTLWSIALKRVHSNGDIETVWQELNVLLPVAGAPFQYYEFTITVDLLPVGEYVLEEAGHGMPSLPVYDDYRAVFEQYGQTILFESEDCLCTEPVVVTVPGTLFLPCGVDSLLEPIVTTDCLYSVELIDSNIVDDGPCFYRTIFRHWEVSASSGFIDTVTTITINEPPSGPTGSVTYLGETFFGDQVITVPYGTDVLNSLAPVITLDLSPCDSLIEFWQSDPELVGPMCEEYYVIHYGYKTLCHIQSYEIQVYVEQTTTPPTIQNVPADVTLACGDAIPDPPQLTGLAADSTVLYGVGLVETVIDNGCYLEIVRVWQVTDMCPNLTTFASQIITLPTDSEPPTFTVIAQDQVFCDSMPIIDPGVQDICGETFLSHEIIDTTVVGDSTVYTIVWTVSDPCGNLAQDTALLVNYCEPCLNDTEAPTVVFVDENDPNGPTYPNNAVVQIGQCDQAIVPKISSSDNCPGIVTENFQGLVVTGDPDCGPHTEVRTWIVTDLAGNSDTARITLEFAARTKYAVIDFPDSYLFDCPDSIEMAAPVLDVICGSVEVDTGDVEFVQMIGDSVLYSQTYGVYDGCDTAFFETQAVVICTSSCQLEFVVPLEMTIACAYPIQDFVQTIADTLTATSTCGPVLVTYEIGPFQADNLCSGEGFYQITWTATDVDSIAIGIQIVNQVDVSPPVVFWGGNSTVQCNEPVVFSPVVVEDCSDYDLITWTETIEFLPDSIQNIEHYKFEDCAGNTLDTMQIVTQLLAGTQITLDSLPQEFVTVPCDSNCAMIPGLDTAWVNVDCGNYNIDFTEEKILGNCPVLHTLVRTWIITTITDTVEVVQEIEVYLEFPELEIEQASLQMVYPFGTTIESILDDAWGATWSRSCDTLYLGQETEVEGECGQMIDIILSATDICNQTETTSFSALIEPDTTAPTVVAQDVTIETVVVAQGSNCDEIVLGNVLPAVTATGGDPVFDLPAVDCTVDGVYSYIVSVTNSCGLEAFDTATITVIVDNNPFVPEEDENCKVTVFPNPIQGGVLKFSITMADVIKNSSATEVGGFTVKLYDSFGRHKLDRYFSTMIPAGGVEFFEINVNNFPKGTYIMQVYSDTRDNSGTPIVQKIGIKVII